LKGFRAVDYISSSSPKLTWRNGRVLWWKRRERSRLSLSRLCSAATYTVERTAFISPSFERRLFRPARAIRIAEHIVQWFIYAWGFGFENCHHDGFSGTNMRGRALFWNRNSAQLGHRSRVIGDCRL